MVHAVQLHSLDLLFMEFVVAMLWFNPFVYFHLRAIRENHEYLADRYAQSDQNSLGEYLECLGAETIRKYSPVPASYFKSSTIKKRIIMLTNKKSNNKLKWRYLGIFPVMAIILVLCQTPAKPVLAGSAFNPKVFIIPTVPFFFPDDIPSRFPLPEAYREKVTWGYEENAIHPISRKETTHLGIDIAAPTGTPVYATAGGVVQRAASEEGWGKLVVVEHGDGYTTFYAHLNEIEVESGAEVSKGEVIGRVGNTGQSTGPHLHYEVRLNGKHKDPADFFCFE
jgi:murein DD-endopeptidase MepM/ murein hydrolase activator NlpD